MKVIFLLWHRGVVFITTTQLKAFKAYIDQLLQKKKKKNHHYFYQLHDINVSIFFKTINMKVKIKFKIKIKNRSKVKIKI